MWHNSYCPWFPYYYQSAGGEKLPVCEDIFLSEARKSMEETNLKRRHEKGVTV